MMIPIWSADREKSEIYFTESTSSEELNRSSLLCFMQVSTREIAALKKVCAFSYGRLNLSRVFLPKFNLRFRWYDHLKHLPSPIKRGRRLISMRFLREEQPFSATEGESRPADSRRHGGSLF